MKPVINLLFKVFNKNRIQTHYLGIQLDYRGKLVNKFKGYGYLTAEHGKCFGVYKDITVSLKELERLSRWE